MCFLKARHHELSRDIDIYTCLLFCLSAHKSTYPSTPFCVPNDCFPYTIPTLIVNKLSIFSHQETGTRNVLFSLTILYFHLNSLKIISYFYRILFTYNYFYCLRILYTHIMVFWSNPLFINSPIPPLSPNQLSSQHHVSFKKIHSELSVLLLCVWVEEPLLEHTQPPRGCVSEERQILS